MPSVGILDGTLPSGPKSLKVKHQAIPHDGSTRLKRPAPASSQITIMGLEPRVQLDVAGKSKKFFIDTGATYSVLTSCSRTFSPQTCTILGATGKTITKRFTWALCCWNGQTFSYQFLVVPDCPPPLLGRNLPLTSKPCSYCSPDLEYALKLSFGGKLTIFTSHQVKQLLDRRGHLWVYDQRILR